MTARKRHRRKRLVEEFRRKTEPGAPPGMLVPDLEAPVSRVAAIGYGADGYEELVIQRLEQIPPLLAKWPVTWINVDGVGDAAIVAELGRLFGLHRLALEDVMHVYQRAKAECYGANYFIVGRMPVLAEPGQTEQISIFFGERFVLTFQQRPGGDCLDPVRARIRAGFGRARATRADHLVYALLDAIVDHYFPLIEECGERLDALEEDEPGCLAPGHQPSDVMLRVQAIKRDLLAVRRIIWPLRDALNTLLRDSSPLIADETRVYLRDVHDHAIQILDLVENYRDVTAGLTEIYLAHMSQRTNEIVKVLTIISTIFIPLTFIVGVYGMNFAPETSPWNMPELRWYWGYVAIWLVILAVALVMVVFFYRRGWLGRSGPPERGPQP